MGDDSVMPYSKMMSDYDAAQSAVSSLISVIGSQSAGGVQMSDMFSLQLQMNNLSTKGQTFTNVIQGVQEVAMSVARNAKGA